MLSLVLKWVNFTMIGRFFDSQNLPIQCVRSMELGSNLMFRISAHNASILSSDSFYDSSTQSSNPKNSRLFRRILLLVSMLAVFRAAISLWIQVV